MEQSKSVCEEENSSTFNKSRKVEERWNENGNVEECGGMTKSDEGNRVVVPFLLFFLPLQSVDS